MNWRRVAEAMRLRKAVQLMDEREDHAHVADDRDAELDDLRSRTEDQTAVVQEISRQAALGSYSRVRVPR